MISRQILLVEYVLSVEKIVDTYNIYLYLFNDNYPGLFSFVLKIAYIKIQFIYTFNKLNN